MKDKNKELAKLLGVEPKLLCEWTYVNTKSDILSKAYFEKYIKNNPEFRDVKILNEVYPDFEKPENFVKLLEITFGCIDFDCVTSLKYKCSPENTFVETYLTYLKNIISISEINLKQQAQKIDWIY